MDVYETIAESVQMAASKARDTEVPIRIKCDPKIGAIEADQKRITQVIVNLLSNALRHTERGDTITVGAERLDGVVRLTVAGHGQGHGVRCAGARASTVSPPAIAAARGWGSRW